MMAGAIRAEEIAWPRCGVVEASGVLRQRVQDAAQQALCVRAARARRPRPRPDTMRQRGAEEQRSP